MSKTEGGTHMDLSEFAPKVGDIPMLQSLPQKVRENVTHILLKVATRTDLGKGDVLYRKGAEDKNTGALLCTSADLIQSSAQKNFLRTSHDQSALASVRL